ncbi:nucleic acid-binding protein [Rostrohypoxylon terebratum]|nr:nucleic acid-binding protein [Rostrohypoxylon terebratum]
MGRPRPKRNMRAAADEALTPPDQLTETQFLAKVIKAEGNSLYACTLPNQQTVIVELATRFRNTVWIRRGGFVLVDMNASKDEEGRAEGEIINIVGDEKLWRRQSYWPKEFPRTINGGSREDSIAGKMPPSDSEDED